MKPATARKITAARAVADTLPPAAAQTVRDLCAAHSQMAETNSRLWHDNAAMRRDMATIARCVVLSEVQRIAGRHVDSEGAQSGKSGFSGARHSPEVKMAHERGLK